MGSSGKKKTTMAKHARENRLRERRLNKQAKKDARKQASFDHVEATEDPLATGMVHSNPTDPLPAAIQPAVQPPASGECEDAPDGASPQLQPDRSGGSATIHPPLTT